MNCKTKAAGDCNRRAALTLNLRPDLIADSIKGQASGARLIREIGDAICDADRLFQEVQAIANSPVALRSFCRELQKHFENRWRA